MTNGAGLRLRPMGIDSHHEFVIYMRRDCYVCRAEGFEALMQPSFDEDQYGWAGSCIECRNRVGFTICTWLLPTGRYRPQLKRN